MAKSRVYIADLCLQLVAKLSHHSEILDNQPYDTITQWLCTLLSTQVILVRIPAWRQSLIFFFFCFCCFYFDLFFFFFFIFNSIDNRQLLHLGIKSQKAVNILYCLQKFSIFLNSHSSCLHNRSILTPQMRFLCSKSFTGYSYIKFLIICFLTCPKLLHLSHTKTKC